MSYYKTCVVGVLNTITRPQTEIFVTVTETATLTVQEQATGTQQVPIGHERALERHSFRPDGLLEVNPNGRHPIYDLIERAEVEWEKKVKRQSKTLDEAVVEYERRYHRAPPKGFDDW